MSLDLTSFLLNKCQVLSLCWSKLARAWSWPPASICCHGEQPTTQLPPYLLSRTILHSYQVHQHSFNPTWDNLPWWGDYPKAGSSAYYQKEASSMKQADPADMFKQPPRASVHQLLWYLLTSCLHLHQLLQLWSPQKTQRNTPMTLEPATEGDIQMEYSSD